MFIFRQFSVEDSTLISAILTKIVEEEDKMELNECQVMVLLSHILSSNVGNQYWAAADVSRSCSVGDIVQWSDAVHHFFRKYNAEWISGELDYFAYICHVEDENEAA